MRPETYDEFEVLVEKWREWHKDERFGQSWFNCLSRVHPALAEEIRTTPIDPFHRDERLPAARAFVSKHWEE